MAIGTRKPGEFCWINIMTPQPAEAREFFAKLLGWTYVEMPGMGHRVQVDGHDIGGLFDVEAPNAPEPTPPHIGVMVKVESADAVSERVRLLGGQVRFAFDIGDKGRMAACIDPNGARFDLWEPKAAQGTDADSTQPGTPTWFETVTSDTDRASKFYGELFGWTAEPSPMPGFTYTNFKLGAEPVAGMLPILPQMGTPPPHWGTYFAVVDIDAAAREAAELGATICVGPQDVPGIGRFCGVVSPQGVMFYVFQYAR